jgi:hypothetical protein
MKVKKLIAITFFLIPLFAIGQNKFTISGYVKDSLSGETLIGSTISVLGKSKGITSNQFGFYSITLPAGTYNFICSYVGYVSQIKTIDLNKDVAFNFEILPKITTEQAVIISSKK